MKKLMLCCAVVAMCGVTFAAWTEISLVGAQAWASSEANSDQIASKVIDGSGFTPGIACPSGTVDTVASNMWLAKSDDQSNHWWMVKFPTTVSVGAMRLWNYNQSGNVYRGFKGVEIYISEDEDIEIPAEKIGNSLVMPRANWQLVHPYAFFPQASGNDTYEGAYPTCFGGNHQARYLLIKQIIQHANGTSAAPGISEIKFYNHTWTASEPSDGKLLLSDGYWQIRMTVLDASAKTLRAGAGANWQQWTNNGVLSGRGDCDFTDVFAQTGWKVVKLREKILSNDGSGGMGNWDRVSAFFGPDVTETEGGAFGGSSRVTYVRFSDAMTKLNFGDFSQNGSNYGNGFILHPSKFSSALTSLVGCNTTPGKFKNTLDFSACTSLTTLPDKVLQQCNGTADVIWPSTIDTVGSEAFIVCQGLKMTFMGPPPTTYAVNSFNHQQTTDFITIYCDNVTYTGWNDWVTTPLLDEEKALYPDAFGWSMNGVVSGKHANLLCARARHTSGLIIIIR